MFSQQSGTQHHLHAYCRHMCHALWIKYKEIKILAWQQQQTIVIKHQFQKCIQYHLRNCCKSLMIQFQMNSFWMYHPPSPSPCLNISPVADLFHKLMPGNVPISGYLFRHMAFSMIHFTKAVSPLSWPPYDCKIKKKKQQHYILSCGRLEFFS